MDEEDKRQKREDDIVKAGVAGAAYDTVQRFGAAIKEHLVSYSGVDNEKNGEKLTRSLKDISNYKINPEYRDANIKQQAGFSAEVKSTAKANAEKIINRETSRRIRTDDIGSVNDQICDTLDIDQFGNIIKGSEAQLKFVGSNADEAFNKLISKDYKKYLDAGVKLEVPSDYYDGILKKADEEIQSLENQIKVLTDKGELEKAALKEQKLSDCQKVRDNLKKSNVSTEEAIEARLHPLKSTVKDAVKLSHEAGVEAAQISALVAGSISIIRNAAGALKGDIDVEDAVENVVKDTAGAAAVGYGTGFLGAGVKSLMQNAKSESIRALSKTNLAGTMVTVAVTAAGTMIRYFRGEISGLECLENLGEQGFGMISSALFAAVGEIVIPIHVVGGMIGGMVGYTISSASYGVLLQALKDEKLAAEERVIIEQACNEHINLIHSYRAEIEKTISTYLTTRMDSFQSSFDGIKESLEIGDVDGFIANTNKISIALGRNPQFEKMTEFDALMSSDIKFVL